MTDDERRQHVRVPYGAWIEDLSRTGGLRFYLTRDLSLGGMLLQAEEPPPIGAKVRLRLVVENESRAISMEGSVVRHGTDAGGTRLFAVQFTNVDPVHMGYLQELIEEISPGALAES